MRYQNAAELLPAELLDATPAAGLPAALERWNARWEAAQEKK